MKTTTTTTSLSPYLHLQSVLEYSRSLQKNYFSSIMEYLMRCSRSSMVQMLAWCSSLEISRSLYFQQKLLITVTTSESHLCYNSNTLFKVKQRGKQDCFIHTNELLSLAFFNVHMKKLHAYARLFFNTLFAWIKGQVPLSCTVGSHSDKAWILIRLCFYYCLSGVHYCDNHSHIHLVNLICFSLEDSQLSDAYLNKSNKLIV